MKDPGEIRQALHEKMGALEDDFGVKEIGLFGSLTKGTFRVSSDIDILVDFHKPVDLFTFVRLKNYLSDLLDADVDLVMKRALKPRIGERILAEVEYV